MADGGADTSVARRLVAQALDIEIGEVGDDTTMYDLEAWDSLGHLRTILAIESALGRRLDAREVFEIESVGCVHQILST